MLKINQTCIDFPQTFRSNAILNIKLPTCSLAHAHTHTHTHTYTNTHIPLPGYCQHCKHGQDILNVHEGKVHTFCTDCTIMTMKSWNIHYYYYYYHHNHQLYYYYYYYYHHPYYYNYHHQHFGTAVGLHPLLHRSHTVVGSGIALQVGMSRVRFPMWSLKGVIDLNLPAALRTWDRFSL